MPFDRIPMAPKMRWMEGRRACTTELSPTGHFLTGWEDQIWILHAMWEDPLIPDAITYAEADQILSGFGERPRIVTEPDELVAADLFSGEVQFGFDTGGGWGLTVPPGGPLIRLTWRDYLDRNGIVPDTSFVPGPRWLGRDFKTNIEPPGEGSLDLAQLITLERILLDHESRRNPRNTSTIYAWFSYFAPIESLRIEPDGISDVDGQLFHGPLDELTSFAVAIECAPNNIWPEDQNWFVTTDADAWGTLVQGPAGLIERLRASSTDVDGVRDLHLLEIHETFDSTFTPHTPPAAQ